MPVVLDAGPRAPLLSGALPCSLVPVQPQRPQTSLVLSRLEAGRQKWGGREFPEGGHCALSAPHQPVRLRLAGCLYSAAPNQAPGRLLRPFPVLRRGIYFVCKKLIIIDKCI